jgi:hypothetical protein
LYLESRTIKTRVKITNYAKKIGLKNKKNIGLLKQDCTLHAGLSEKRITHHALT